MPSTTCLILKYLNNKGAEIFTNTLDFNHSL